LPRYVSANTGVALPHEPHLVLEKWLYDNWPTSADPNYPSLPLRDEIGFGYHWIDRQRADKSVTLETRKEPEVPYGYLNPMTDDYYPRVWIDFYIRQIDNEFEGPVPQTPPKRLTSMKDFIRDKVDSDHTALAASGIAIQQFDGFEQIPNLEELNVFHGIAYVRLMYRLVGVT
jgi:hypothetical protein